jgi:hypothetical protein
MFGPEWRGVAMIKWMLEIALEWYEVLMADSNPCPAKISRTQFGLLTALCTITSTRARRAHWLVTAARLPSLLIST